MPYIQLLTDVGRNTLSDAETGLRLTFTRLGLSDEAVVDPENTIPGMIDIGNLVMDGGIASVVRDREAQVTITSRLRLQDIPNEFALETIGVFCTIEGDPNERLYAVCASVGAADIIRPASPGSTTEHTLKIAIVIGIAPNVDAIFDPDLEFINIGLPEIGPGWFHSRLGNQVRFKRVVQGTGIVVIDEPETIRFSAQQIIPVGSMMPFAGSVPPVSWFVCQGQPLSRVTYAELFSVIGITYGPGNGTTTFNLPDARNRTFIGTSATRLLGAAGGAETHALTVGELASHAHTDTGHIHSSPPHDHPTQEDPHTHNFVFFDYMGQAVGVGNAGDVFANNRPDGTTGPSRTNLRVMPAGITINTGNAAIQPNGSNQPHNNMQPFLAINYIIKA